LTRHRSFAGKSANELWRNLVQFKHFRRFPDLFGVQPEIVDFGLGQGRSVFATAGVVRATLRNAKKRERRPEPKDAIYGWALSILC